MTDTQTALEALMILADGGYILESSGSYGQMTICDTEGKEYVINFTSMDFSALSTPKALQIRPVFASPPAELEALLLEAVSIVDGYKSVLDNSDYASGVCCCGDDMANHSDPMSCGHSPVDAAHYYADKLLERAAALHNKLKEK